jgi:GntR family transcriptional regulator
MMSALLEKNSPLPLYFQLQEALRIDIESGALKPGMQLPSEAEFCRRYGVSHATVKRALGNLVNQHLLYRLRGKGTFVAEPKIQKDPRKIQSFTEEMQTLGFLVSSRVLEVRTLPADPVIADKLQIAEEEPITLVRRLRRASDRPIALQSSYVPVAQCPNLLHEDLSGSLYDVLRRYGLQPERAQEIYSAVALDQVDAGLLEIRAGSPALRCERISRGPNGQVIEYVESVLRGDLYQVTAELTLE